MSQPAATVLAPLPFELVYDDGEPMENYKHVCQMILLLDLFGEAMKERGRSDFFCGGNTFVYYSIEQARGVAQEVADDVPPPLRKHFRGPDVFFVDGVRGGLREAWIAWEEGGRLPDLIVELLSPSTEGIDRGTKMDLYARVFRTRDYFLLNPDERTLEGFRLVGNKYKPIAPDRHGRVRSAVLDLDFGLWEGIAQYPGVGPEEKEAIWVRLFRPDGSLIPTSREAVEAELAAAEAGMAAAEAGMAAAEARAAAAEAELERLRAQLAKDDSETRRS
jgi:Uma2 family endonuclease